MRALLAALAASSLGAFSLEACSGSCSAIGSTTAAVASPHAAVGPSVGDFIAIIPDAPTITSPTSAATYNATSNTVTVSGTTSTGVSAPLSASCTNSAGGTCTCTVSTGTFSCASLTLTATALNTISVTTTNVAGISSADTIAITPFAPGSPTAAYLPYLETGFADGDLIGTLHDYGSAGKDVTQTSTARPTYNTPCVSGKVSNRPCAALDGGDYMKSAAFAAALTQPNLVCVVAAAASPATNKTYIDSESGTNRHLVYMQGSPVKVSGFAGTANATGNVNITANQYDLVCVKFNDATTLVTYNGTTSSNKSTGSQTMTGVTIGGQNDGTNLLPSGSKILAALVYDDGTQSVSNVFSWAQVVFGTLPAS